jgi:hypothetical protein
MDEIYVYVIDGGEGDMIIYLSKDEMLEQSRLFPKRWYNIMVKHPMGGYRTNFNNLYINGQLTTWGGQVITTLTTPSGTC